MIKKQRGFTAVEGLLIILVVAALAGVAYYFFALRTDASDEAAPKKTVSAQQQNKSDADCDRGFTQSVSGKSAFSVCLPNGWKIERDTTSDGYIIWGTQQPVAKADGKLSVQDVKGYGGDGPVVFHAFVTQASEYGVNTIKGAKSTFNLASGQEGTKYSRTVTQDEACEGYLGCRVAGDKSCDYVVELADGKLLVINYNIYNDEMGLDKETNQEIVVNKGDSTDNTKLIDRVVRSISIMK